MHMLSPLVPQVTRILCFVTSSDSCLFSVKSYDLKKGFVFFWVWLFAKHNNYKIHSRVSFSKFLLFFLLLASNTITIWFKYLLECVLENVNKVRCLTHSPLVLPPHTYKNLLIFDPLCCFITISLRFKFSLPLLLRITSLCIHFNTSKFHQFPNESMFLFFWLFISSLLLLCTLAQWLYCLTS